MEKGKIEPVAVITQKIEPRVIHRPEIVALRGAHVGGGHGPRMGRGLHG